MVPNYNPFSLEGKTVLVTGASSGIGRAVSVACSKMGATIIACGRNEHRLEETLSMLESNGCQKRIIDINNSNAVNEMVAGLPLLDGVVHCAGISIRSLCKQLDYQQVNFLTNTNFIAPIMLQTELLKGKRINKGSSIIFIASIASDMPSIGNSIYSATKGAIISYSRCLSLELAPRKVRVNCISPGMVWTDLIRNGEVDEEQLKADEANYPLKRYGQPEDVANLAIYMLSDASSWMTGSNVKLAGGV